MPNPSGVNQFGGFAAEKPYGAVKKASELTREAPMSGAPVAGSAVNAPRQAKRRAVQGRVSPTKATNAAQRAPVPPDYAQEIVATWMEIANTPGASELVKQYALRAANQAASLAT